MKRRPAGKKSVAVALVLAFAMIAAVAGCSTPQAQPGDGQADPDDTKVKLVLYFPDADAMYLVAEERTVEVGEGDTYELLALRAIIDGPTVPEGTRLVSLEIAEGVAYVNFSREFQENHWGGSTGETMTIYSIVNTLTESPNVTAVKFLIEGEELDSLAGHYDCTEAFERNEAIIAGN